METRFMCDEHGVFWTNNKIYYNIYVYYCTWPCVYPRNFNSSTMDKNKIGRDDKSEFN